MAAPIAVGGQINLNVGVFTPTGDQFFPRIVGTPTGSIFAAWNTANEHEAVFVDATGDYVVSYLLANDSADPLIGDLDVVALDNGDVAVAWRKFTFGDPQGDIELKYLRAEGSLDTVGYSQIEAGMQQNPVLAVAGTGRLVLVNTSSDGSQTDIMRELFGFPGAAVTPVSEVTKGVRSSGNQENPNVATLANGTLIVVWLDQTDGSLRGSRMAMDGTRPGEALLLGTAVDYGDGPDTTPGVTALEAGGFAVSYRSAGVVKYRVFDSAAQPVTGEMTAAAFGATTWSPQILGLRDGRFVIVTTINGGGDISGQVFSGDGTPDSAVFTIATTAENERQPSLTLLADGRFAVAYATTGVANGAGTDIVMKIFDPRETGVSISGTASNDDYEGSAFNDLIVTGSGSDRAMGNGGDDTIDGGAGNDTIGGGAGNDRLIYSGGVDALDGGADIDVADFSALRMPVWVSLIYTGYEAWVRGVNLGVGVWQGVADLVGIENLIGTAFGDYLAGNAGNNTLDGRAGDDQLLYTGGFDTLLGDAGTDTADFSPVAHAVWVDLAYSGAEAWKRGAELTAGDWSTIADLSGIENLVGTTRGDSFKGDANANHLDGGSGGNDTLLGEGGSDRLVYRSGFDTFDGGTGTDTVDFSPLGIPIWVNLGIGASAEAWTRGASLSGTNAWEAVAEIALVEDVIGTSFDDYLQGNAAANWLQGGLGNDQLLYTAGGFDRLNGDGGTDTADYSLLDKPIWVDLDYSGNQGWTRGSNLAGTEAWLAVNTLVSIENVTGSAFADSLDGDSGANRIRGLAGADIIIGALGADTLSGGADADRFVYRTLADISLLGGTQSDMIDDFQTGIDKIDLSAIDGNSALTGPQPFVFVGTAPTNAPGTVYAASDGLRFDVDGGGYDYLLRVTGTVAAGDIILA